MSIGFSNALMSVWEGGKRRELTAENSRALRISKGRQCPTTGGTARADMVLDGNLGMVPRESFRRLMVEPVSPAKASKTPSRIMRRAN